MKNVSRAAMLAGIVLLASSTTPVAGRMAPSPVLLADDIAGYASLYGISEAEAGRQMGLEDELPAVAANIRLRLGDAFTGL